MKKDYLIVRWLIKKGKDGKLDVSETLVNKFAPLNRVLDQVGSYSVDFFTANDTVYYAVFEPEEIDTNKSIILLGKVDQGQHLDMTSDDEVILDLVKKKYFAMKTH